MTRHEFLDSVTSWDELINFCNEYNCSICDDLIHGDNVGEFIDEDISESLDSEYWWQIRDALDAIPTGYDFYVKDARLEYTGLDDGEDFYCYQTDVIDWADRNGVWDEDEEEAGQEETNEINEEEESQDIPEEDFSVGELFALCNGSFASILKAEKEEKKSKPDLSFFF